MIESKEKRERITETIERWAENTKIKPYLRDYDIPGLAYNILGEFYHVHLCCTHMVRELGEGIELEVDDCDGKRYGSYCKDCAEQMIDEGYARKLE